MNSLPRLPYPCYKMYVMFVSGYIHQMDYSARTSFIELEKEFRAVSKMTAITQVRLFYVESSSSKAPVEHLVSMWASVDTDIKGFVDSKHIDSHDRNSPIPAAGSRWIWEAGTRGAEERIIVTSVEWLEAGSEYYVWTARIDGKPFKNGDDILPVDLNRFWEAVTPYDSASG